MPTDKLPINQGSNKDTEEVGLSTGASAYLDVVVDDQGTLRRRPAAEYLCNVSHRPVDGMAYWPGQDKIVASANGVLSFVEQDGTVTACTGDGPTAGQPISFVEYTSTQAYVASGGRIISLTSAGVGTYIADAQAPTTVDHISIVDKYLLANKTGTEEVWYSEVADPTTWNSEFVSAEGKPDTLLGIGELNKLVYLLGANTVQVIRDDGVTPWVPEYQGYVSRGVASKDAFIRCPYDNRWYFLDNTRQVVRLDGLQIAPVSLTFNRYLASFANVYDVRCSYLQVDGRPYILWYFPTEQKTLVLDVRNQDGFWYEWNKWDTTSGEYTPFIAGAATVFVDQWGASYCGDRLTGNIYRLTHDVYADNSTTLRSAVRTARINKGSESRRKICKALHFRLKRLRTYTGTAPVLMMKYRDNGREEWAGERQIPLYLAGGEYKATVRALGAYYSRQWEFFVTDSAPMEIASIEEEWEAANG